MQAHDVMTAEVVTVNADTPLPQIACVLLEHGISAVPVLDADGVPIGMVSDCDLATHSASDRSGRRDWWLGLLADGSSLDDNVLQLLRSPDRTAGSVMATPVITVGEATDLVELVRLLARNHIKRVPVLKDGHITGMSHRRRRGIQFQSLCWETTGSGACPRTTGCGWPLLLATQGFVRRS